MQSLWFAPSKWPSPVEAHCSDFTLANGDQEQLIPVAVSSTLFTHFLCLNSICLASSGCDRESWCLHNSFHSTSLSCAHYWPCTLAPFGEALATPHEPPFSPSHPWCCQFCPGLHQESWWQECWSWLRWSWVLQHHGPGQVGRGATIAHCPDTDCP